MVTMYGWIENLEGQAKAICDCLGHGAHGTAAEMIIETAAAETGIGKIKDTTVGAGMGLTQFDKMPFEDIKARSMSQRDKIIDRLKIDIELVEWTDLRYNPFLALLFTRLHYRLRPEPMPKSRLERAAYWKKWYNTEAGKGTEGHYLQMCDLYLP